MKRLLAILVCLMLLFPAALAEEAMPIMEVHQMSLGVADGYYIRVGDTEIVIDGGNPNPERKNNDVMNYLRTVGAGTLDAHIITHWHLDHCMNINAILTEFGDENTIVYSPSVEVPGKIVGGDNYNVTLQVAPLANGIYRQMVMGDVVQIGDITITCIGPEKLQYDGCQNVDSLNFVLQYGSRRFLFTGDYAQSDCITNQYRELCTNVDVLKFPHHGLRNNKDQFEISYEAVAVAAPEYVMLPSGLNNWYMWLLVKEHGRNIPRENVMSSYNSVVVILTDGGDYFEARTKQDPAKYAPKGK